MGGNANFLDKEDGVLVDDFVFIPLNASQLAVLFPPTLSPTNRGSVDMVDQNRRQEQPEPMITAVEQASAAQGASSGKGRPSSKSTSKGSSGMKSMMMSTSSKMTSSKSSKKGSQMSSKAKSTGKARSMRSSSQKH